MNDTHQLPISADDVSLLADSVRIVEREREREREKERKKERKRERKKERNTEIKKERKNKKGESFIFVSR